MSKHAARRYLGNRAVQTGNAQESQAQQSLWGVRSTLLWSLENKKYAFFIAVYCVYLKLWLPRVLDLLCLLR